jgi:hypothetical protein
MARRRELPNKQPLWTLKAAGSNRRYGEHHRSRVGGLILRGNAARRGKRPFLALNRQRIGNVIL